MSVPPSRAVSPRKTISEKKAFIEQWGTSNARMEDVCISNQISLSAFKYWRRQFGAPSRQKTKSKAFLPMRTPPDKLPIIMAQAVFAEIILLNSNRILFHQSVEPGY